MDFIFKLDEGGKLIDSYQPYLISKNGHIITLDMNVPGDCSIIGYVHNVDKETICPVKLNHSMVGSFKGSIQLPLSFISNLKGKQYCYIKFVIANDGNVLTTESFRLNVDTVTLKLNTIEQYTTQYAQLIKEMAQIRYAINNIKRKTPDALDQFNTFPRVKGMTLTVLDDLGNLGFDFPFLNSITRVNGLDGLNHEVNLYSKDIPHNDKASVADSIDALQNILREAVTAIDGINNRLNSVEEALAQYINDDVL